jgi:hypothetical protein
MWRRRAFAPDRVTGKDGKYEGRWVTAEARRKVEDKNVRVQLRVNALPWKLIDIGRSRLLSVRTFREARSHAFDSSG